MRDEMFVSQNTNILKALKYRERYKSFELMHRELDPVWKELCRILIPGGFACINIGDAVRTVGDDYMLYSNHSRIIGALIENGFSVLPCILWRKPTNAPNK